MFCRSDLPSHSRSASCRLLQVFFNWLQCFGQKRIEQPMADVLTGGEAGLQPVAQRHQFIDLGDDAALFGKGWERNKNLRQDFEVDVLLRGCWCKLQKVSLCVSQEILEVSRVLKNRRWNEADDAIGKAGVKTQYPAIRDVRGNRDAKGSIRPF